MSGDGLTVRGGAGGVTARFDDIQRLGRLCLGQADDAGWLALRAHRVLLDPFLLASVPVSPLTAARAQLALVAAADGPRGLTALAVGLASDGVLLQAAVAAYRARDDALAELRGGVQYAAGRLVAPGVLAAAGLAAVLPEPVLARAGQRAAGGLLDVLESEPGLVELAAGTGGGLVDAALAGPPPGLGVPLRSGLAAAGSVPRPRTTPQAAGVLALLYPDGRAAVQVGPAAGEAVPPIGVAGLLATVAPTGGQRTGRVSVRRLTGPDGVRWLVSLPGTERWELPGQQQATGTVRDTGTNLRAVGGAPTAYSRGVLLALQQMGVPAGARVMLVGHSQGGLVAAELAGDAAFAARYQVTHVLSAGAPLAGIAVPPGVQLLALENDCDLVPLLDGSANPDQPRQLTVRFHTATHAIGGNHALEVYRQAGERVDASGDPSVRAFLTSARPYTAATASVVHPVTISRELTPGAAPR